MSAVRGPGSGGKDTLPGKGLLGWLGRQVGYVAHAVKTPVGTHPPGPSEAGAGDAAPRTIYQERKVVEQPLPGRPDVILRRTTIDEAIVRAHPPNTAGAGGAGGESFGGDEPDGGDRPA